MQKSAEQTCIDVPYGYRGQVGLIIVGPNLNPTPDIARMMPTGILCRETRIHMEPHVDLEETLKLRERLPQAVALLEEGLVPSVVCKKSAIAFACTAGSLAGGPGWAEKEIEDMQSRSQGIPCTNTAAAATEAMKFMELRKMVFATPYIDEINKKFKQVYEAAGFEVLRVKGLGIRDLFQLGAATPAQAYQIAREVFLPEADGIFIPCTNFRCIDIIEQLEVDTGKPVITANQATAWKLLQLLECNESIEGFGTLLRKTPRVEYA